jgi:predicted transcriptional regulator
MNFNTKYVITTEWNYAGQFSRGHAVIDVTEDPNAIEGIVKNAIDQEKRSHEFLKEHLANHPDQENLEDEYYTFVRWSRTIQGHFGYFNIYVTTIEGMPNERRKYALDQARRLDKDGLLQPVKSFGIVQDALITTFEETSDEDLITMLEMIEDINHNSGDSSHNMQSFAEALQQIYEEKPYLQEKSLKIFSSLQTDRTNYDAYQNFVSEVVRKCFAD